jgi:hypothetical protein
LRSCIFLALAGIVHFVWGRYCNYRSLKAIGSNFAEPLQESSVLIALALAVMVRDEAIMPLKAAYIFGTEWYENLEIYDANFDKTLLF